MSFAPKGKVQSGQFMLDEAQPTMPILWKETGCQNGDQCPFPHVRPVTPASKANPKSKAKASAKASADSSRNNGNEEPTVPVAPVVPVQGSAGKPVPVCAIIPDIGWIVDSGSGFDIVCDNAAIGKHRK